MIQYKSLEKLALKYQSRLNMADSDVSADIEKHLIQYGPRNGANFGLPDISNLLN